MEKNNYDRIAWGYDFLSKRIFGNAIVDSQKCLLKYISPNSSILIVGGGTGKILEDISEIYSSGIAISYVEISKNMLEVSQKRNWKNNHVHFIHLPIENYTTDKKFDIIITPFLFDNFSKEKIESVIEQLDAYLKQGGHWLIADFRSDRKMEKYWQKILLKSMYIFFRFVSKIEAKSLVNMHAIFPSNYRRVFEKTFYRGFIQSVVYVKE